MDERKGFFTPEGEDKIHALLKFKGVIGIIDLPLLRVLDNIAFEKLKEKAGPGFKEYLPVIYGILDTIIEALPSPTELSR